MKRWTSITLDENGIADRHNDFERTGLSIYDRPRASAPVGSGVSAVHEYEVHSLATELPNTQMGLPAVDSFAHSISHRRHEMPDPYRLRAHDVDGPQTRDIKLLLPQGESMLRAPYSWAYGLHQQGHHDCAS